jgi:hypothetical protein
VVTIWYPAHKRTSEDMSGIIMYQVYYIQNGIPFSRKANVKRTNEEERYALRNNRLFIELTAPLIHSMLRSTEYFI